MTDFVLKEIQSIADFNPVEKLPIGTTAKSIPMAMLKEFQRKIIGYEIAEFKSGSKFRNGDVLVAKITPCLENGKTAFVDILENDEIAFGSTEFIVLRAKDNTDKDFLYYFSRSPAFRKKAIGCMEGTSGRKRVNENSLKMLELPIPSLPIQKKIASVLSTLDEKIALNNQINATLEQIAKTLYDYWFVQFDFPDDNGKPYKSSGGEMVYNETLKRDIPKGWEVKKLSEIANLKAGGDKPSEFSDIPTEDLTVPIFSNGIINDGLYGYTNSSTIKKPSITISARGTIGFSKIRMNPFVPIIRLISITPIEEFFLKYLEQFFKDMDFENSGSVQQQLTVPQIKDLAILLPSEKTLNKFHGITLNGLLQIENNNEQIIELTKLRDWLLPMLMNGQVTVQ